MKIKVVTASFFLGLVLAMQAKAATPTKCDLQGKVTDVEYSAFGLVTAKINGQLVSTAQDKSMPGFFANMLLQAEIQNLSICVVNAHYDNAGGFAETTYSIIK